MQDNTPVGSIIMLIVGVAIGILVLTFVGTLSGTLYQKEESGIYAIGTQTANITVTVINNTAVYLGHNYVHSNLVMTNVTTMRNIGLGNFTIDYTNGYITLKTTALGEFNLNNSNNYAQYTYGDVRVTNSIRSGVMSGFETLDDTGGYMPIIVLAVIIAMVLTIVLGLGMAKGGNKGAL